MARWRLGALFGSLLVVTGAAGPAAAVPLEPVGVAWAATPPPSVVTPVADWRWPLEPSPAVVRRFQPPPTPWSAGHRGVDLFASVGQPVLAAGAGVVSFSGVVAGVGVVSVEHAGGLRTTYEPVRARAPTGLPVAAGDRIGEVDAVPGHCAPLTCLHWGLVRGRGPQETYLDPLAWLGLRPGPPVLLPYG
jgi:murein DD-endopeptidase MepM/ murein hydrolase activator NlpD